MHLSRGYWLSISQPTRKELARILDIPRSGGVSVEDNKVTCDGYTDLDLMTVKLEVLQAMFETEDTDFYLLLEALIDEIEYKSQEDIKNQAQPSTTTNSPITNEVEAPKKDPKTLYPRPQDQKVKVLVEKPAKKIGRPKKVTK